MSDRKPRDEQYLRGYAAAMMCAAEFVRDIKPRDRAIRGAFEKIADYFDDKIEGETRSVESERRFMEAVSKMRANPLPTGERDE